MTPRQKPAKSIAEAKPISEDTPIPIGAGSEIKDATLPDGSTLITICGRETGEFGESQISAPKNYSKIGALDYLAGNFWNRKRINATENTILEAMINEGMISTPIEKRCKKRFEKKFKVVTPDNADSKLHQETMMFFDEFSLWLKLWQGVMNAECFACGLLWFKYADIESYDELIKPVKKGNVALLDIELINEISFKETQRKPNNDPLYYVISTKEKGKNIDLKIHPSRIIQMKNDPFGMFPDGVSSLLKTITHVDDLRSIKWIMAQLLYRRGAPITMIYIPVGFPEAAKAELKKNFKQAQPLDVITIPFNPTLPSDQQVRVEWNPQFSTIGNLQPIIDLNLDSFCASIDYPRQLWQGSGAGSISGSETNITQWLSGISADQNMKDTPNVRTIIKMGQQHGQLKSKDAFFIEWTPLEDVSLVDLNRMQLNSSVIAVNLNNAGWDVVLTDNGLIDFNATKKRPEQAIPTVPTELPNPRAGDIRNPDSEAPGKLRNTMESYNLSHIQELEDKVEKLYKQVQTLTNIKEHQKASTPDET